MFLNSALRQMACFPSSLICAVMSSDSVMQALKSMQREYKVSKSIGSSCGCKRVKSQPLKPSSPTAGSAFWSWVILLNILKNQQNTKELQTVKKTRLCFVMMEILWSPGVSFSHAVCSDGRPLSQTEMTVCVRVYVCVHECYSVCWKRGLSCLCYSSVQTLCGRQYLNTHSLSLPPTVAQTYFITHTHTLTHTLGKNTLLK